MSDPLRKHVLEASAGVHAFVEELQAGPRAGLELVMVSPASLRLKMDMNS
jgi:hypothetical protein